MMAVNLEHEISVNTSGLRAQLQSTNIKVSANSSCFILFNLIIVLLLHVIGSTCVAVLTCKTTHSMLTYVIPPVHCNTTIQAYTSTSDLCFFAVVEFAQRMKSQLSCKICLDQLVGIIFLPCGHAGKRSSDIHEPQNFIFSHCDNSVSSVLALNQCCKSKNRCSK